MPWSIRAEGSKGTGITMSREVHEPPDGHRELDRVRPDREAVELACCGGCAPAEATDLTEILTTIVTTRLRGD
jgi:hypothetical protein